MSGPHPRIDGRIRVAAGQYNLGTDADAVAQAVRQVTEQRRAGGAQDHLVGPGTDQVGNSPARRGHIGIANRRTRLLTLRMATRRCLNGRAQVGVPERIRRRCVYSLRNLRLFLRV